MRITGGTAKNRKLLSPPAKGNRAIRPTTDRVREAVFNILGRRIAQARVLDLYAGTGSFGLDALSRDAELVVFVDNQPAALRIIEHNLRTCFTEPPADILRLDLQKISSYSTLYKRFATSVPFDIVFMDPPYEKNLAETTLTMVAKTGLVAAEGLVIVEESWRTDLPPQADALHLHLQRRYGEAGIWIYEQQTRSTETGGTN